MYFVIPERELNNHNSLKRMYHWLKKFCLSEIESGFIVHLHSRVPVFHKTSVPTVPQFTESRNITDDMGVHTVTYYVNVYIYRNGLFYVNVTLSD